MEKLYSVEKSGNERGSFMAMMAVRIEDPMTLKMNEFFDYHGRCYGLSRSRSKTGADGAQLEDFYECTVLTDWVEDVPVVFLYDHRICGWYTTAKIYRRVFHPSLFLEGNICARSTDAVLLREDAWILADRLFEENGWDFKDKLYRVIEDEEEGYEALAAILKRHYEKTVPVRYDLAPSMLNKGDIHRALAARQRQSGHRLSTKEAYDAQYAFCIEQCMTLASRLMEDACESISDIKTLREYADMAVTFGRGRADGYYYRAMAEEQLGFIREGLKSVGHALKLEPDGADILALKANLLADQGNYEDAAGLYGESFDISGDESYLLMKGRVLFLMGNVDGAYKVYRMIKDKQLLEAAGINLKDMEHKWPFVAIRGLKNLLKKNG